MAFINDFFDFDDDSDFLLTKCFWNSDFFEVTIGFLNKWDIFGTFYSNNWKKVFVGVYWFWNFWLWSRNEFLSQMWKLMKTDVNGGKKMHCILHRISHSIWRCIVYIDMTYRTEESSRHLSTIDQWHPKMQ